MSGSGILLPVIIGALQAVPGIIIAAAAERIPPNPLIGFRVSYTISSRRVWVRINKTAGWALALIGLTSILLGVAGGLGAQAVFLTLADVAVAVLLVEYSRILLERTQIAEPPTGGPGSAEEVPRLTTLQAALVAAATAAALALLARASLSLVDEGLPEAALTLLALAVLDVYAGYLSIARPEAYVRPWLSSRGARLLAIIVPLLLAGTSIVVAAPVTGEAALCIYIAILVAAAILAVVLVLLYARWTASQEAASGGQAR